MRLLFCLAALTATKLFAADLILTDGRKLADASIVSQSPLNVMVKHAKGLTSVPKAILPDEMRARYPEDRAAAEAQEKTRASAEAERVQKAEAKKAEARAAQGFLVHDASVPKAPNPAENEPKVVEAEVLRNGVKIVKQRAQQTKAIVTVQNVSTNTHTFDWREVRGVKKDGTLLEPTEARASANTGRQDFELLPGASLDFQIGFGPYAYDGNPLVKVMWEPRR